MPSKTTDKYIFLDRDNTIIEDKGYTHKIEHLKFLPGVVSGLKRLQNLGYKFIVISNQAGIARKYFSREDADRLNNELISRLSGHGIKIEKIYICPHHPDITGPCSCRKPSPGLALKAAKEFNINLSNSYFIGDKDSDIELGYNCKGTTILIKNDKYPNTVKADMEVSGLDEVAELLS